MKIEKILELLLLSHVLENYFLDRRTNTIQIDDKEYCNYDEIHNRYKVLMKEFLSPYVINKDSKE